MKKNRDFDFVPGSALYIMQQQLEDNFKLKEITTCIFPTNSYVVDEDMNYYKVYKKYLSKELKKMNIGYSYIDYKGNHINIWSVRKSFRIAT